MKLPYLNLGLSLSLAIGMALFSASTNAAPHDNNACEKNPLFNPFPRSYLSGCERSRFQSLQLTRRNAADDDIEFFNVEGEYWYYFDEIENDSKGRPAGKLEVFRNYENAVKKAKGEIIYTNENYAKVIYHLSRKDGEFWGEVSCGRGGGSDCGAIMHKIVRLEPMEQSVTISSEVIAKSMFEEGKVVLYGLYFDTDKSVLKPESAATLKEMAKWLKENPNDKVFIVGHTDMQGSVEHNLQLSDSRAEAVVQALIKQHRINSERLKSEGVGPYSPVAGNRAEKGKAQNRRVEMVLR